MRQKTHIGALTIYLLLMASLAGPLPVAAASGTSDPASRSESPAKQALSATVERLRTAQAHGSLPQLLAAVGEQGVASPSAAPSDPLAGIAAAIGTATTISARAIQPGFESLHAPERGIRLLARALDAASGDPAIRRGDALRNRVEEYVDSAALKDAAVQLASAIELALPELHNLKTLAPGDGDECDLLESAPALCIGGADPNTYTHDYSLLIDLGGNDVYRNSAGAASPTTGGLPVSVVVDLDGDDQYRATLSEATGWFAQGAGAAGGIGMLVDAAGNDSYSIEFEQQKNQKQALGTPWPCGMGCGFAGVGVLTDMGGSDTYSYLNRAVTFQGGLMDASRNHDVTTGMGYANDGGLGVLADGGLGDDDYLLQAKLQPATIDGVTGLGSAYVAGLGTGHLGGTAVFSDDGGADSIRAEALNEGDETLKAGDGNVWAMGTGGFGDGFAILGLGPTDAALTIHTIGNGEPPGTLTFGGFTLSSPSAIAGFGAGLIGNAAMIDAGGNDRFVAEAIDSGTHSAEIGDDCNCTAATAAAIANGAAIYAHGFGTGGTGMMQDLGGSDVYSSTARSTATAYVSDLRQQTPTPEENESVDPLALAEIRSDGRIAGLGGSGEAGGSEAYFLDQGGDDRYIVDVSQSVVARSSTVRTPASPRTQASAGSTRTSVQGCASGSFPGIAEFIDIGGADSYYSRAAITVDSQPQTEESPGSAVSASQGLCINLGFFLDADGGLSDSFVSIPALTPNSGERGVGVWTGPQSVGVNT